MELLPEAEWTSPSEIILTDEAKNPEDDSIVDEEKFKRQNIEKGNAKERQRTGKIVGIIKRKWRQYSGIIVPNEGSSLLHFFEPAEKRIPKVRIETRQGEILYNKRVLVAIDQWPRNSKYPQGHFVRSLGPIGDQETENEVLLIEHDVPHSKFSEEVLKCLPKIPWTITEEVSQIYSTNHHLFLHQPNLLHQGYLRLLRLVHHFYLLIVGMLLFQLVQDEGRCRLGFYV